MTAFSEVLASITADGDGSFRVDPSDDWRQGRTLFGGLSAALCYAACERIAPRLPPLRSAQIAYIGPSAGEALLRPVVLRKGKSVTFMACDLIADGAIATRALFVFGGARPSTLGLAASPPPELPGPDDCMPLFERGGPTFAQHLDQRLAAGARPVSGAAKGEMLVWVRHRDESAPSSLASLVALGDALPPATMPRLTAPAAISTITWQFDIIDASGFDGAGWHLIETREEAVGEGYSAQQMALWDADGTPLLRARQNVAVFA